MNIDTSSKNNSEEAIIRKSKSDVFLAINCLRFCIVVGSIIDVILLLWILLHHHRNNKIDLLSSSVSSKALLIVVSIENYY